MRTGKVSIAACLLLSSVVFGQTAEEVQALNAAWDEYLAIAETGPPDRLVDAAQSVVEAGRAALPEGDERLPFLEYKYGSALLGADRRKKARKQLESAIDSFEDIYGKDSVRLVQPLSDLADSRGGDPDHASAQLRVYKRALKITAGHFGERSPEYATLSYRAGRNTYEQSSSISGRKYVEEAYEIFRENFGAEDRRTGSAVFLLGQIDFWLGKHGRSSESLESALIAFGGDTEHELENRRYIRGLLVKAYESNGESDLATQHCVALGKEFEFSPDQDYEPLFRLAPMYPMELLRQGIEGHVDIEFTVDEDGFIRNPMVMDSFMSDTPNRSKFRSAAKKDDRSFEDAALKAVARFRYAPRFEGSEPVPTEGVETRISFYLED